MKKPVRIPRIHLSSFLRHPEKYLSPAPGSAVCLITKAGPRGARRVAVIAAPDIFGIAKFRNPKG